MDSKFKILIILDSLKYKTKENKHTEILSDLCNPKFYYTTYENRIITFFQKTPIIGNLFSHITYWSLSLYEAVNLFIFRKNFFNKIFINPIVAIFYCFFIRVFKRKENIIVAGFLFEKKENKTYIRMRKWFVNFCYKHVSSIVVYSKYEVQLYSSLFPLLSSKFIFIKYGRDYDFFEENHNKISGMYVASGGVSNRDFNTLLNAFTLLRNDFPELKCKIATKPKALSLYPKLKNIEIIYDIKLESFGRFLDDSLMVVIPLANTPLSAGHMVLLEAMYYGKIILITDIFSIQDYVGTELVHFYKPENAQDLANKIKHLYLNKNKDEILQKARNAKEFYFLNYTFSSLLKRIIELLTLE